jgi:hypothetical protein
VFAYYRAAPDCGLPQQPARNITGVLAEPRRLAGDPEAWESDRRGLGHAGGGCGIRIAISHEVCPAAAGGKPLISRTAGPRACTRMVARTMILVSCDSEQESHG